MSAYDQISMNAPPGSEDPKKLGSEKHGFEGIMMNAEHWVLMSDLD